MEVLYNGVVTLDCVVEAALSHRNRTLSCKAWKVNASVASYVAKQSVILLPFNTEVTGLDKSL